MGWKLVTLLAAWRIYSSCAVLQDDTFASLPEENWFVADKHLPELQQVVGTFSGQRTLHCIDLFGFSGSIYRKWVQKGFEAVRYDIALNPRADDVVSKRGFLNLLRIRVCKNDQT